MSAAIDSRCPQCSAQPGQPCRRPNGDKYVTLVGVPRFHAKRTRATLKHFHDYQRVGYGGAGWSLFRCACGAEEIDA